MKLLLLPILLFFSIISASQGVITYYSKNGVLAVDSMHWVPRSKVIPQPKNDTISGWLIYYMIGYEMKETWDHIPYKDSSLTQMKEAALEIFTYSLEEVPCSRRDTDCYEVINNDAISFVHKQWVRRFEKYIERVGNVGYAELPTDVYAIFLSDSQIFRLQFIDLWNNAQNRNGMHPFDEYQLDDGKVRQQWQQFDMSKHNQIYLDAWDSDIRKIVKPKNVKKKKAKARTVVLDNSGTFHKIVKPIKKKVIFSKSYGHETHALPIKHAMGVPYNQIRILRKKTEYPNPFDELDDFNYPVEYNTKTGEHRTIYFNKAGKDSAGPWIKPKN